ncbi:MAG: nicotinate (nicotinamide) nucleotide adenylyltransferase, partial [Bacteroidota bacterium]
MSRKIGLFFGSFNPIHVGHLVIANFMATQTHLDQVWLVVSPQNPLKTKKSLAKDHDRLNLVRLATEDNPMLRVSDIEFNLPKPSYTIDTLTFLQEKYPNEQFALIMGGDNLASLHKWKNYERLLDDYDIYVYQRPNYALGELIEHDHVHIMEAPLMQISASYIRRCIAEKKSIRYLVPRVVQEEIE